MACLWEAWLQAQDTDIVYLDSLDGPIMQLPKELPATKKLVEEMLEYPIAVRDRWMVRPLTGGVLIGDTTAEIRRNVLKDHLKRAKDKFNHLFKKDKEAKTWTQKCFDH